MIASCKSLLFENKFDSVVEIGCALSVGTGRMPESSMNPLKLTLPNGFFEAIKAALAVRDLVKLIIQQVNCVCVYCVGIFLQ